MMETEKEERGRHTPHTGERERNRERERERLIIRNWLTQIWRLRSLTICSWQTRDPEELMV
jgi:hypothetical protein